MAFVNVSKVETWDGFYLWANHDIFFMSIFVLFSFRFQWQIYSLLGGSPVVVVNGWDLQSEGSEFKSRRRILDRHFSHLFVVRIAMFVWKDENKHKIGRGWPIFKKSIVWPTYTNWKSKDVVLGIGTHYRWMVGADDSTEQWQCFLLALPQN